MGSEIDENTDSPGRGDERAPFEVAEEGLVAFALAYQNNPGSRTDRHEWSGVVT